MVPNIAAEWQVTFCPAKFRINPYDKDHESSAAIERNIIHLSLAPMQKVGKGFCKRKIA